MKKTVIVIAILLVAIVSVTYGIRRQVPSVRERLGWLEEKVNRLEVAKKDLFIRVKALEEKVYGPGQARQELVKNKFSGKLEVGQRAYLNENSPKIEQIVDKRNMLVEITVGEKPIRSPSFTGQERFLTHVPIIRYEPIRKFVWIKGINTSGLVDGKSVEIKQLMKITGTKTYETAIGTKTVFVLEPYKEPASTGR